MRAIRIATVVLVATISAVLCADEPSSSIAVIDVARVLKELESHQSEMAGVSREIQLLLPKCRAPEPGCGTNPFVGCDVEFVGKLLQYPLDQNGLERAIARHRKEVAAQRRKNCERLRALQREVSVATIDAYQQMQREVARYCREQEIDLVLRSNPSHKDEHEDFAVQLHWDEAAGMREFRGIKYRAPVSTVAVFRHSEPLDITDEIIARMNPESDDK